MDSRVRSAHRDTLSLTHTQTDTNTRQEYVQQSLHLHCDLYDGYNRIAALSLSLSLTHTHVHWYEHTHAWNVYNGVSVCTAIYVDMQWIQQHVVHTMPHTLSHTQTDTNTRTPKIRTMKSAYSPRTMFLYDRFNGMWCTPWHTHSLSCERHTHSDTNTRTPLYGQWSQCIHCDLSLYLVVFNRMYSVMHSETNSLSHTHTLVRTQHARNTYNGVCICTAT